MWTVGGVIKGRNFLKSVLEREQNLALEKHVFMPWGQSTAPESIVFTLPCTQESAHIVITLWRNGTCACSLGFLFSLEFWWLVGSIGSVRCKKGSCQFLEQKWIILSFLKTPRATPKFFPVFPKILGSHKNASLIDLRATLSFFPFFCWTKLFLDEKTKNFLD